jgi:Family of unknown function (DUF6314)
MDAMECLWGSLAKVQSLRFVAKSSLPNGWNGTGGGSVVVEAESLEVLLFHETGSWQTAEGRSLPFRNVYRWSRTTEHVVRLEHLRFGPGQPVYLFDLALVGEGPWASVHPHQCRDDCYSAQLWVEEQGIRLVWTIAGPSKQESIEYTYAFG